VDQPLGFLKTVVRIISSGMFRHSDCTYQISIDLEALDCQGNVTEIEAYHHVDDILQAWRILQPLRPLTIHYVEGEFEGTGKEMRLMCPVFSPYFEDNDLINCFFTKYDTKNFSRTLQPECIRTVCGSVKEVLIDKTEYGDVAIIQLAERDDYCLALFPDLFETYKSAIFGGKYLEYCGIPQNCHVEVTTDNYCESMIIVNTIELPDLPDEIGDIDHEQ